ncbi:MAG: Holliday junction branch migration protein RuvA [bacterium]|nr:Holliday junction branch migration protein RuvA [bacterium]
MIHSLQGTLTAKKEHFFVIDVHDVSFHINTSLQVLRSVPPIGSTIKVFTHLHVREDLLDLYGFLHESELALFQQLMSVSGIGPKSAIGILGIDTVEKIKAAISEGKSELLIKSSGVGRKTADRIILELRGKMQQEGSGKITGAMEADHDIVDALINLGYAKHQAQEALRSIDQKATSVEDRIKAALKVLKNHS